MVQFHPYSAGRDTKVLRLEPIVNVATTTVTATTAPTIADRTGAA